MKIAFTIMSSTTLRPKITSGRMNMSLYHVYPRVTNLKRVAEVCLLQKELSLLFVLLYTTGDIFCRALHAQVCLVTSQPKPLQGRTSSPPRALMVPPRWWTRWRPATLAAWCVWVERDTRWVLTALQSRKAVFAYFTSKQILPFSFAWRHSLSPARRLQIIIKHNVFILGQSTMSAFSLQNLITSAFSFCQITGSHIQAVDGQFAFSFCQNTGDNFAFWSRQMHRFRLILSSPNSSLQYAILMVKWIRLYFLVWQWHSNGTWPQLFGYSNGFMKNKIT